MEKDYFIVKNDMVKNKLEELFLLSTKDSFYTLNLELKNLSFGEKNDTTEKIDKCINDFLELLRKDCVTASYCLDRLINASHKREKYEENYVFLKSFFCVEKDKLSEFLPMWIQYGNDAKGVCVILDECTFEGVDLLKVNYLGDDGKCGDDVMDELIQNYKIAYENIISLCNNELR